jgi:hypothetical protein
MPTCTPGVPDQTWTLGRCLTAAPINSVTAMSKRTVPVAGAIATAVLVLLFGNPPFVDWINRNVNSGDAIGYLLHWLTWPKWLFTPPGGNMTAFVAYELRALLIIILVFGILAMVAKGIGSGGVALIVGWVALILGAALAAFISYFISPIGGEGSALLALQAGGSYGLFVGWIVGIVCAMAKRG